MEMGSPSKVMIALGLMIAAGLAIGIKKGAVDVSGASQLLAKAVDTGIKELDLFNSENINTYNSIVENAVDDSAKTTKGVYEQSSKHEQKTPLVVLALSSTAFSTMEL